MKDKFIIAMNNKAKDTFRKKINKKLKNKFGISIKECSHPKDRKDENSVLVARIKSHKKVQIGMQEK